MPGLRDGSIVPRRSLTMNQKAFAQAYATPGSDTFGKGKASMLKVNPSMLAKSAEARASALLHKPSVMSEVDRLFEKYSIGKEQRAALIHTIMSTNSVRTIQYDGDGNPVSSVETPNHKAQLQAVDLANRMDGTYAKAGEVARAQARVLEPVLEAYSRQLRDSLLPHKGTATGTHTDATEHADSVQATDVGDSVPDGVAGQGEGTGGQEEAGADGGEGVRPPLDD